MRLENAATGEVVEVIGETPELLVLRVTWPRPGHRAIAHIHPGMQERWEVVRGRAGFDIDGAVTELVAGQAVVAEAGQRHLAWNASDGVTELLIEMRPALRWAEFVRRLFAGDPPAELLAEYVDEVQVSGS